MARMMGNQVWRGQTMEHTPRTHREWRRREGREWQREADALGDEFAPFAAESLEWAEVTFEACAESWPEYSGR